MYVSVYMYVFICASNTPTFMSIASHGRFTQIFHVLKIDVYCICSDCVKHSMFTFELLARCVSYMFVIASNLLSFGGVTGYLYVVFKGFCD